MVSTGIKLEPVPNLLKQARWTERSSGPQIRHADGGFEGAARGNDFAEHGANSVRREGPRIGCGKAVENLSLAFRREKRGSGSLLALSNIAGSLGAARNQHQHFGINRVNLAAQIV